MKKYKHIIITGPSFVGKTFVADLILNAEHEFMRCITGTTRTPRTGEKNGKDYFFFTLEKFLQLKQEGYFLETNEFIKKKDGTIGTMYGTPKNFIDAHRKDDNVLCVVDPNGAVDIQRYLGDECITVFIAPESIDVLIDRIHKRRTNESDEEINDRLELAKSQMARSGEFDYCLINIEGIDNARKLAKHIIDLARIPIAA